MPVIPVCIFIGIALAFIGAIALYNGSMRLFHVRTREKAGIILSLGLLLFLTSSVIAAGNPNYEHVRAPTQLTERAEGGSISPDGGRSTPSSDDLWLQSILHCVM